MDYSTFELLPMLPMKGHVLGVTVSDCSWDRASGIQLGTNEWEFEEYSIWLKGRTGRSVPWMMMDVKGNQSGPDLGLVKGSRIRGLQRWVDPGIKVLEDVFDVFSLDVDRLLISTLGVNSLDIYEEALEVSDCCLPMLAMEGSRCILGKSIKDPVKLINDLIDIGYDELLVIDLDRIGRRRGADEALWEWLSTMEARIIPCGGISENDVPRLMANGYNTAIRDAVLPDVTVGADWIAEPMPEASELSSAAPKGSWTATGV